MKRAKMFLVTIALMMISIFYAETSEKLKDLNSLTAEIEQMLRDYDYSVEKGSTVTIFFSISEDNSIQCVNVASTNPDIDSLLQKKLDGRLLDGPKWQKGKIYELAIEIPKDVVACSHF
ncbi:MAG: hypothetical protein WBL27_09225 [Salinimicrobium sp.]